MDQVLQAVNATIATVVAGVLVALAHKLAQRFNIQIDASKDAVIRAEVQNAITFAEEKALHMSKVQNTVISSTAKLDMAVSAVLDKVPGITADEAQQLVHEELPKVRAALGEAMGAVVTAATVPPSPLPILAGSSLPTASAPR